MSWTDETEHDPGITILELLACVLAAVAFFEYARRRRTRSSVFRKLILT